jgi:hypothetical protein
MPFIGSRVALKSGTEVLTSDSSTNSVSFTTYNPKDTREEIVFYVPSALNNVYVQACNRQILSIDSTGRVVLKPVGSTISATDTFSFVCLGMNLVTIQASNGKYVRQDGTNLIADQVVPGDTETFEVVLVLC